MALTISERKNVRPLPGAYVRNYELAEAAELGDFVYIDGDDKVQLAVNNVVGKVKGRGVIVAGDDPYNTSISLASGSTCSVVVWGPVVGFSGMDPSLNVFVSDTAGEVTQTAPSAGGTYDWSVGYPLRSDILMIMPQTADPISN